MSVSFTPFHMLNFSSQGGLFVCVFSAFCYCYCMHLLRQSFLHGSDMDQLRSCQEIISNHSTMSTGRKQAHWAFFTMLHQHASCLGSFTAAAQSVAFPICLHTHTQHWNTQHSTDDVRGESDGRVTCTVFPNHARI